MINELKKIMTLQGVTSDEGRVASYLTEQIKPFVDEIKEDPLGNVIALKRGITGAKKIMLAAHMDEIGFMVNFIQNDGFIRVSKVGGISYTAYAYDRVIFAGGARGVLVPEGKVKPADFAPDKFYVDIGAKDKKEAERRVKIGELLSVESSLNKLSGNKLCGRPFDDRVGCYIIIEIAKALGECDNDVYFVFTTQEEVGTRGACAAAYNVQPDIGIAFDVTGTGDTPGCSPMAVKLGGGAAIKIKDGYTICNTELVSALRELAEKDKVPYQFEILEYGGTDAAMMQTVAGGSKAGCISIPCRYIHTQNEMIEAGDIDACVRLGTLACGLNI